MPVSASSRVFELAGLKMTLVPDGAEAEPWHVGVPDVDASWRALIRAVESAPVAARTLIDLLALTAVNSVPHGLVAESSAYSMLMSGAEYRAWLAGRSRCEAGQAREPDRQVVLLERNGDVLTITLNRPERHNAFDRHIRDALCDAFDLVLADHTIDQVVLRGNGASFCSGGDLNEFGTTTDLAAAHVIRVDRSVAAGLDAVRDRVTVQLHGACIGAGIELASFASRIVAHPASVIRLPELSMGLIPGAGGTVGITRRIGAWRTAFLALSGEPLPVATALRWGLVDDVVT
jgi:hypothetical protein